MKIRSDIHAGATYSSVEECQEVANYWKMQAQAMDGYSKTGQWPAGQAYPVYPYPPTTYPTSGGGYVNGVYYPDKSGVCGGTPPPPTTTGGGYVGGVYYPDKSGVCG